MCDGESSRHRRGEAPGITQRVNTGFVNIDRAYDTGQIRDGGIVPFMYVCGGPDGARRIVKDLSRYRPEYEAPEQSQPMGWHHDQVGPFVSHVLNNLRGRFAGSEQPLNLHSLELFNSEVV